MWDVTISLAIMPSLPVKHDLIVGGVGDQVRGGEMLPMLGLGCRASSLRSEKAGCCREAAGMSIVYADGPCSV